MTVSADRPLSQVLDENNIPQPVRRLTTAWSDLVDRAEASKRETLVLPLRRVNFDVTATVGEAVAGEWPPVRFSDRQERLRLYRQVFDGTLSGLIQDRAYSRVAVNEFRQACLFKGDLLTSVPIGLTPEVVNPAVVANVMGQVVVNLERDGLAVLLSGVGVDGVFMRAVDADCWFPRSDGGHILMVPFVSDQAGTSQPDRVRMTMVEADGRSMEFVFVWAGSRRGELLGRRPLADRQHVTVLYRSPLVPGWGTSLFDDLGPVLLEHTVRLSSYSRILNAHENPLLNVFLADDDLPSFGGSTPLEAEEYETGLDETIRPNGSR